MIVRIGFYASSEVVGSLQRDEAESGLSFTVTGEYIMAQQKLYAFHVEADSMEELLKQLDTQVSKLKGATGAGKAASGKAEAASKSAEGGSKASLEDVKKALTSLKDAHDAKEAKSGIKVVKGVLKKYSVTNSTDLTEDQYPAVIKSAEEAMPKEGDGDDF